MALFGSYDEIARACGVDEKTIYGWARASKLRDAGDVPSARHMRKLRRYAIEHNLGLTAEHLVRGASEAEIDTILNSRDTPARAAKRVAAE